MKFFSKCMPLSSTQLINTEIIPITAIGKIIITSLYFGYYLITSEQLQSSTQYLVMNIYDLISLALLLKFKNLTSFYRLIYIITSIFIQIENMHLIAIEFRDNIVYIIYSVSSIFVLLNLIQNPYLSLIIAIFPFTYSIIRFELHAKISVYFLFVNIVTLFIQNKKLSDDQRNNQSRLLNIIQSKFYTLQGLLFPLFPKELCIFQFNEKCILLIKKFLVEPTLLFQTEQMEKKLRGLNEIQKGDSLNFIKYIELNQEYGSQSILEVIRHQIDVYSFTKQFEQGFHVLNQSKIHDCRIIHQPNFQQKKELNDFKDSSRYYEKDRILKDCSQKQIDSQREKTAQIQDQQSTHQNVQNNSKFEIQITNCIYNNQISTAMSFEFENSKENLCIQSLKEQNKVLQMQQSQKDHLLASVSHDFKTPINGISAILEHLIDDFPDKQTVVYYLQIIKKNVDLLLFMIKDILDYYKIQKNQLRLCPSNFQLPDLINVLFSIQFILFFQEIIELFKIQASQKGIQIESIIKIKLEEIYSDPSRIQQILHNLISNALKYTQKGKITILVEELEKFNINQIGNKRVKQEQYDQILLDDFSDKQEDLIKITVKDTGVGIPDSLKKKLFKMYGTFDHHKGFFFFNQQNYHQAQIKMELDWDQQFLKNQLDYQDLVSIQISRVKKIWDHLLLFTSILYLKKLNLSEIDILVYLSLISRVVDHKKQIKFFFQIIYFNQISQVLVFAQQPNEIPDSKGGLNRKTQSFNDCNQPSGQNFSRFSFYSKKQHALRDLNQIQFTNNQLNSLNSQESQSLYEIEDDQIQQIKKGFQINTKTQLQKQSIRQNAYSFSIKEEIQSKEKKVNLKDEYSEVISQLFKEQLFVLIVDDEAFNVLAFHLLFKKYPQIVIEEAYNGEQAIKKIAEKVKKKEKMYQCIFLDLTMPILDGYSAALQIKSQIEEEILPSIFLIALSGYDDEKEKAKCYNVGFDAFISKPLKFSNIVAIFQQLF